MSTTTQSEDFVEREMTLEEWAALDEDVEGELVDGRLLAEEEVGTIHDVISFWLAGELHGWLKAHAGTGGTADTKFAVAPRRGRKPDMYVYLPGKRPPATNLVRIPPDVMVEIVTPTPRDQRRDRLEKFAEYAAFGVRWYWIVDPTLRTFQVFERNDAGLYVGVLGASSGRLPEIPGMPGFELDLDALWAQAEGLEIDDG